MLLTKKKKQSKKVAIDKKVRVQRPITMHKCNKNKFIINTSQTSISLVHLFNGIDMY